MKPKLGFALLVAAVLHVALFSAVAFRPKDPAPLSEADFTAELGPFLLEETVSGPYGSSTCALHKLEMSVAAVPIAYGLPVEFIDPAAYRVAHPDEPPPGVRTAQFPNARSWVWGGCCLDGLSQKQRVYVCRECQRLERAWILEQGN